MSLVQSSRTQPCVVDPIDDPRWSELVRRCSSAGAFHDPLWLALIRDCYRYPMSAVCLARADGSLTAGIPMALIRSHFTGNRLVSIPFSDACGPVLASPADEPDLVSALDEERRHIGLPLEVHGHLPSLPGGGPSDRFWHHVVALGEEPEAILRAGVSSAKRRGAARARRAGVMISASADPPAMEAFFRLHVLTRRKQGVPTQPHRFFRALAKVLARGLGFVLLAKWGDTPIAAAVYLRRRSVLTYKYGASDPAHLDKRPNDLLMLEAIRIGCESGCHELDLGRTELDNEGLRRFKRQLGAEERELTYTMAPAPDRRRSVRSVSHAHRAMIRRAPPGFGRLLGAAVYRHYG